MRNINTVLSDLNLTSAIVETNTSMQKLLKLFEEKQLPAVIVTQNEQYKCVITKTRCHELMSKQFMFELFRKRTISSFLEIYDETNALILNGNTPLANAANMALNRDIKYRYDPIVVKVEDNLYKILDLFELLIAQTEQHLLTLSFLKEVNEFKKDVIGIAAHDMKNPLNAIIGSANIIKDISSDNEIVNEYIHIVYDSAKQLNILVSDLLNSALHDLTEISLDNTEFDLLEMLRTIHQSFMPAAQNKSQNLHFENNNGTSHIVNADKNKLREAFENLVSNAIKYSEKNKDIYIRLKTDNYNFIIEIEDNGLGFNKEDMEKMYNKFQRLSARPTGSETSNGLGLYIVKKVIELHNGFIKLQSEKNSGSKFSVHIPRV